MAVSQTMWPTLPIMIRVSGKKSFLGIAGTTATGLLTHDSSLHVVRLCSSGIPQKFFKYHPIITPTYVSLFFPDVLFCFKSAESEKIND